MWVARYASAQNDALLALCDYRCRLCFGGEYSGSRTISGVLLGSIMIGIINNALPMIRVSPFWKMALQGLIILVAVLVNILITRNAEKAQLKQREARAKYHE